MKEIKPRISLAGLFLLITALCVEFACWGREINLFVAPLAAAFICGLLIPWGITAGVATGAAVVVVNAVLVEKGPSGPGPTEVVIPSPIHLVVFAILVILAAWGGKTMRSWLSPDPAYFLISPFWPGPVPTVPHEVQSAEPDEE